MHQYTLQPHKDRVGRVSRPVYLLAACLLVSGCGESEEVDPAREGRMVYVDTVTAEAVVMEITSDLPAVQPRTGERTLMPGLYCPKCKAWHPVPPVDQINRIPKAGQCPKTGAPLTAEGPWPREGSVGGEDPGR